MFGANLVIVAQIDDELSHGQAKFPRILSQNGQNDLEGQGQWPTYIFNTIQEYPRMQILVILAQIYDELSCGQAEFPINLSQNGQNDLEGQGQWPTSIFNTIQEYPMMHVWCKFGDSSSNLWWVIMQTR